MSMISSDSSCESIELRDAVVVSSNISSGAYRRKVAPDCDEIDMKKQVAQVSYSAVRAPTDDVVGNGGYNNSRDVGCVGIKWRVRIVRVYDSEEEWKGVVEIYFHWKKDASKSSSMKAFHDPGRSNHRRRSSISVSHMDTMATIEEPDVHPIFLILNDENSHSTEEIYYTCKDCPSLLFGYMEYTVNVHERLELQRYPFDRQFFKLEIECNNGIIVPWSCRTLSPLVLSRLEEGAVNNNFFGTCDTPSWKLDIMEVSQNGRPASATMKLGLSRLSGFYVSNVALPYFLIGTAAVLTTGIESENYADRFSCMITLFLTIVAIKFVANFVPVISYSTLLDYYTLTAYIFLSCWMIENYVVSPFVLGAGKEEVARQIDIWGGIIYVGLWSMLHVFIMVATKYDLFRKKWEDVVLDDNKADPDTHREAVKFD
mmetsp:Transcript_5019/g.7667  ORF Transcript_5019/g.7667 Transcript_5019/m.7667 type:complete len:428 (-) Transcript_5019:268-1551(-)